MSSILSEPVLVLNKSWNPIDTCTVASAFSKLFTGAGRFLDVETYVLHDVVGWLSLPEPDDLKERAIRTARVNLRVPEVLVMSSDVQPKRRVMQFSRRNLLKRDLHICQYCGTKEQLTVDHVLPKTKGGTSSWTNCVMACLKCNAAKAGRTPEEAGMALRIRPEMKERYPHDESKWRVPYRPAWSPVFKVSVPLLRPSWYKFLPEVYTKTSLLIA